MICLKLATRTGSFQVDVDATPPDCGVANINYERKPLAVPGTWNTGSNYADSRYQLPRIDTPHSGINYYPPQAVLDGTWTKLQRKRDEGMRNALSEGTITQLPDTKAGTGLPAEVSIIRTTTQTAPTPQPITI